MAIIWPHWETIPVRPIDYDEKLTPNAWDKILIADNDDLNKMKYWKWENFKWEDAPLTQIQYSSDNTNWSSSVTPWDHYIRFSSDNGSTWWAWVDVSWPQGIWIDNIQKTSTAWLVDTYTITYDDNSTYTFTVTNGAEWSSVMLQVDNWYIQRKVDDWVDTRHNLIVLSALKGNWISDITKTWTSWLVDTYTITYDDSTTDQFTVTNWTNWTNWTNGTDAAEIVSATFVWDNMQFTKDDSTTFSILWAKTDLKWDPWEAVGAPQKFNPDSTDVSNWYWTYALAWPKTIAFVTINWQVLSWSEYSLSWVNVTITPTNWFDAITDEIQVFQNNWWSGWGGDMLSANNLSDVSSVATSRTNLDVYSKSEVDWLIPDISWKVDWVASSTNEHIVVFDWTTGKKIKSGWITLASKADSSTLTSHTSNTSNPHSVTKAQVWLWNVDNTSDLDKPISTATQSALNGKEATLTAGTTSDLTTGTDTTNMKRSPKNIADYVKWSLITTSSTKTADYTLALWDAQTLVYMNKATAVTLTIPTNASVAFPVDTQIDVVAYGAGDVSIAGAGGVTVNSLSGNKKINWQYVWVTLKKVATDTWLLIWNLKA